ncbi:MAG: glutamate N-acetyltransferase/amino-acid N-acetyltransferase [Lentisphaeria bacterium]|jgi:glutamate N-acetyltransferase/amino-acid N-acetyltransferase
MAVGEVEWPNLPAIAGVKLGVAAAGIKYPNRNDVSLVCLDERATVAGVFTKNAFIAAPVTVCKRHIEDARAKGVQPQVLLINSGNANACTGALGYQAAVQTCAAIAELANIQTNQVLPFSTGVIGELLPVEKIIAALPAAYRNISGDAWFDFAKAIMTTDTRPKGATVTVNVDGHTVSVNGVAKGSGMINPNMATMLAYVATDAAIDVDILDNISRAAANKSFNRITIDGDTSTNDACMLMATGHSSAPALTSRSEPHYQAIFDAIVSVYKSLAQQVVLDGEGATKFVEIAVGGGATADESLAVAYAIAHSPLVKTALYASDPNWGRIVCAIGYADIEALDAEKVNVWLDDVLLVEHGCRAASYSEEQGQRVLNQAKLLIKVDLGRGNCSESVWTTDLSHEYIRINAEYRS